MVSEWRHTEDSAAGSADLTAAVVEQPAFSFAEYLYPWIFSSRPVVYVSLVVRHRWQGPVAEAQGPVAEAQGPVAEAQGPMAEVQGPVAEVQGPVAEVQGLWLRCRGLWLRCRGLWLTRRACGWGAGAGGWSAGAFSWDAGPLADVQGLWLMFWADTMFFTRRSLILLLLFTYWSNPSASFSMSIGTSIASTAASSEKIKNK